MKRFFAGLLATLFALAVSATTFNPIQLLNPAGSVAGQAIVSTGPTTGAAWGGVGLNGIAAIAANTVLGNATGSSAAPTALPVPSCSTSSSALNYTTSGGASAWTCNTAINAATLGGATFASPGNIGTGTPGTGRFTTLTTTAMSRVLASTTNAQSIASGAFTAITTYTTTLNQGANFVAATGVYTAPAAGLYEVKAGIRFAAVTTAAGNEQCIVSVFVNGAAVYQAGQTYQTASTSTSFQTSGEWLVNLNANDIVTVRVFQNSGSSVALDGSSAANYININQLP